MGVYMWIWTRCHSAYVAELVAITVRNLTVGGGGRAGIMI